MANPDASLQVLDDELEDLGVHESFLPGAMARRRMLGRSMRQALDTGLRYALIPDALLVPGYQHSCYLALGEMAKRAGRCGARCALIGTGSLAICLFEGRSTLFHDCPGDLEGVVLEGALRAAGALDDQTDPIRRLERRALFSLVEAGQLDPSAAGDQLAWGTFDMPAASSDG